MRVLINMWETKIPNHITVLYIYAILNLVLLFHVTLANGHVIVTDIYNATIRTYEDYPASFGPNLPSNGLRGRLHYVVPHDACAKVEPPPQIDNRTLWIALIARSHNGCDFAVKILNAENAGYNAAIVHNFRNHDNLVHMGAGAVGNKAKIPSVFVGWHSGDELASFYQYSQRRDYTVILDPHLPFNMKNYLFPFAAVMGGCLMIGCFVMMGRSCRNIARRHRSRLPSRHLKKIPIKKFKKGEAYDVCAICLDEYEEGDKLRVLPCAHAYHCKCIDPWLTKNKRTCPVCKRRVIPRDQDSASDSDSEEEASPAPTERTPLLGRSQPENHGSSARRGRFESSGLPESVRNEVADIRFGQDNAPSPADSEQGAVGGISVVDETMVIRAAAAAVARRGPGEASSTSTGSEEPNTSAGKKESLDTWLPNLAASPPDSDNEHKEDEVLMVIPPPCEPVSDGRRPNNHVV